MARKTWRPANMLNPLPAVLVTCRDENGHDNVMTAAWAGTICSDPVMISVSIRSSRHSYDIIRRTKEFVVNCTNEELALFTDYAGIYSGSKVDKFDQNGRYAVTRVASNEVKAPTIAESPIALECRVKQIIPLGSHDLFIAEVVSVTVNEDCLDEAGRFVMKKARLIAYCHGEYYALGKRLGKFGFSSAKKERSRRSDAKNRQKKTAR